MATGSTETSRVVCPEIERFETSIAQPLKRTPGRYLATALNHVIRHMPDIRFLIGHGLQPPLHRSRAHLKYPRNLPGTLACLLQFQHPASSPALQKPLLSPGLFPEAIGEGTFETGVKQLTTLVLVGKFLGQQVPQQSSFHDGE